MIASCTFLSFSSLFITHQRIWSYRSLIQIKSNILRKPQPLFSPLVLLLCLANKTNFSQLLSWSYHVLGHLTNFEIVIPSVWNTLSLFLSLIPPFTSSLSFLRVARPYPLVLIKSLLDALTALCTNPLITCIELIIIYLLLASATYINVISVFLPTV